VTEIRFETSPDAYRHWTLGFDGPIARLSLHASEREGLRPGYQLKLNRYDLAVDIELADAIQRLRFEHPEARVLVLESGLERVFCAGANIQMLGSSSHAFKVNFCKFTNETRLYLEELSAESGVGTLAALASAASGGGYELALACDSILLQDDARSTGDWSTTSRRGVASRYPPTAWPRRWPPRARRVRARGSGCRGSSRIAVRGAAATSM